MLGKKGIAVDDAFEVAFGVFIAVIIILLFGAHRVNLTKTTNLGLEEVNARIENTNLLLGYLSTEITGKETFADLIIQQARSADYAADKQLRESTESFFNDAVGEDKWLLAVTYPDLRYSAFGGVYEETYSTKTLIPTFDNNLIEVQLTVARK